MTLFETHPWSAPRWLRRWAVATVALLFALLALGAVVTSFRVGMADPVWPTRPWHLFTISWEEPRAGFLVEHLHRLAGFVVGGAVTVLAVGLWLTERKPALRWGGAAALTALLAAFGQLHGTLIKHQRLYNEAQAQVSPPTPVAPTSPDWAVAIGPTLAALAVVAAVALAALRRGSPGRGVRVLGVVLLVAVMAQGMLGGLRVYLNALFGTDLAAIHGIFSQVVVALAVGILVGTAPRRAVAADDRWVPAAATARWAVVTAVVVFGQVVAGAVLRHTASPLGPRLHLLLAFAVLAAVVVVGRLLSDAPRPVRRLKAALHALTGMQLFLGVEAWLVKFAHGVAAAAWQPVTVPDAALRTAHTLTGYALFAVAAGLAVVVTRSRATIRNPQSAIRNPQWSGPVEVVV
jgi:heme a synthase